jgi:hypothetical protein
VLHSFTGGRYGAHPVAGLIADSAGNLYGTTEAGGTVFGVATDGGVVFKISPPVPPATQWTETVLYTFCKVNGCQDGRVPAAGLIADSAGNLYGTTAGQVRFTIPSFDVVFKLAPPIPPATRWTETALRTFCSFTGCPDGANPVAGLIADSAGNLYGTLQFGGGGNGGDIIPGSGVVFKLSPPVPPATQWNYTVLHSFRNVCEDPGGCDGFYPQAGLIADSKGNLYGTTELGFFGEGCSFPSGCGGVFELSPPVPPATQWTETVLYSFTGALLSRDIPPGSLKG